MRPFLENVILTQVLKKFYISLGPKRSILYLQKPVQQTFSSMTIFLNDASSLFILQHVDQLLSNGHETTPIAGAAVS
jgi:hypothetical protein